MYLRIMFQKLKDKLKSWTKSISKEEVKKEESIKKEEVKEKKRKSEKKQEKELKEKKTKKTQEKEQEKGLKEKTKKFNEKEFKKYSEELEILLLENNVALEVVDEIIKRLEKKILREKIKKKELEKIIKQKLKEVIKEILIEPFNLTQEIKKTEKPYVILFCGINGTGKTTSIAKLANFLKKKGFSCVLAAGDTFRAASIEQLKIHGERLGIKVISSNYNADPASVGFDAIKHAQKKGIDCVLIDTAGRMYTDKNLLREIEKISRVCNPNLKIFVGESITGNDAVEQARTFDNLLNIDGIILTKADVDKKAGAILSIGYVTKKPILFLGTGQKYENLEEFKVDKFIKNLGL